MHANPYLLLVYHPSTHVPPLRQRPTKQALLTETKENPKKKRKQGNKHCCLQFKISTTEVRHTGSKDLQTMEDWVIVTIFCHFLDLIYLKEGFGGFQSTTNNQQVYTNSTPFVIIENCLLAEYWNGPST